MAKDYSFDVVCRTDLQEAQNAVNQAAREIGTRYDFKGSKSSVSLEDGRITLIGDDDFKLRLVRDILNTKLVKRGISLKNIREENKKLEPLPTVIERYADVFRAAGLAYTESFTSLYESRPADLSKMEAIAGVKTGKWLGVAPFARYQGKVYPIDEMEQVVATLSKREDLTLFLFGAKGYEEAVLEEWAYRYPRVKNVVGKYTLDNELALISQLDLLLSMDSANMHFASLVGTRVLSVWGATHIYTGFYGYRQRPEDVIGLPLPCRPCSQFGQKECSRGDWACLTQLPAEKIVSRVQAALAEQ